MSPPYFPVEASELRGQWSSATIRRARCKLRASTCSRAKSRTRAGARSATASAMATRRSPTCPTTARPRSAPARTASAPTTHRARARAQRRLLVHDAQLFPAELAAEADFGHAVADYAVDWRRAATPRSSSSTTATTAPTTRSTARARLGAGLHRGQRRHRGDGARALIDASAGIGFAPTSILCSGRAIRDRRYGDIADLAVSAPLVRAQTDSAPAARSPGDRPRARHHRSPRARRGPSRPSPAEVRSCAAALQRHG